MQDKWARSGWIHARGETRNGPTVLAHRPDPEQPGETMCRLVRFSPGAEQPVRLAGSDMCGRCGESVSRARRQARRAAEMLASMNGALPVQRQIEKRAQEAADDRRERARDQGTSVPTVSGGLPTLGRRRR